MPYSLQQDFKILGWLETFFSLTVLRYNLLICCSQTPMEHHIQKSDLYSLIWPQGQTLKFSSVEHQRSALGTFTCVKRSHNELTKSGQEQPNDKCRAWIRASRRALQHIRRPSRETKRLQRRSRHYISTFSGHFGQNLTLITALNGPKIFFKKSDTSFHPYSTLNRFNETGPDFFLTL